VSQWCRILDWWQVHGKLNTHTGAAHGVAQLKRKFFPEVREITLELNVRDHKMTHLAKKQAPNCKCLHLKSNCPTSQSSIFVLFFKIFLTIASNPDLWNWFRPMQLLTSFDVGAKFDSLLRDNT